MKHFLSCLFLLFIVLLSACQSPLVSNLAAQPGEKLFWDDFSDGSGNWPQISDQNGSMGITNGAYQVQILLAHYEVLASPGHTFQDAQVEVDAFRLAGPVQNLFGLVCRAGGQKDFYFFAISSDGYYALGKTRNGATSLLGQDMMVYNAAINQGSGLNHLRLDCIGETLKGYVNNQIIAVSNDADLSSGEAGLLAGTLDAPGAEVVFDNFVVYKP
jgi:hypothetical protein